MNATPFDVSPTPQSTIGLARRVALETSGCERTDVPGVRPDPKGVGRKSSRRFPPYIQDPPVVRERTLRPASI